MRAFAPHLPLAAMAWNQQMNLGFVPEYTLGHVTHGENLKQIARGDPTIQPTYVDLPFQDMPGRWSRLPLVRSNWSVRASPDAYLALRPLAPSLQAVLFTPRSPPSSPPA